MTIFLKDIYSLANVFGTAVNGSVGVLCALGQIAGIWTGGGCLVPWGLISAAAICGVSPIELATRNLKPILIGFAVTTVVAKEPTNDIPENPEPSRPVIAPTTMDSYYQARVNYDLRENF